MCHDLIEASVQPQFMKEMGKLLVADELGGVIARTDIGDHYARICTSKNLQEGCSFKEKKRVIHDLVEARLFKKSVLLARAIVFDILDIDVEGKKNASETSLPGSLTLNQRRTIASCFTASSLLSMSKLCNTSSLLRYAWTALISKIVDLAKISTEFCDGVVDWCKREIELGRMLRLKRTDFDWRMHQFLHRCLPDLHTACSILAQVN